MKRTYCFWIILGAILMIVFGYILKFTIPAIVIYILIYKPIIDMVYIKKRGLFKGHFLFLKYPFWGVARKLLSD